jgi:hypothetical protein
MTTATATKRKPGLMLDMCLTLNVVELARRGLLHLGLRECPVKIFSGGDDGLTMPVRAVNGPLNGILTVSVPVQQDIGVRRVETAGRRWWRLACPGCRQPVRRLYLPAAVLATGGPVSSPWWSCRKCAGVCYARSGRRGERERLKRRLLAIKALLRGLVAMKDDLKRRLAGLSGRAPVSTGPAWRAMAGRQQ